MNSILSPIMQVGTGLWFLGRIANNTAIHLTLEEIQQHVARHTELEELAKKVAERPADFGAVEELYYGPATGLIDAVLDRAEKEFCQQLNVKSFEPYESDGGLADGIAYNAHSLLTAAGVINRETGETCAAENERLRRLLADVHTGMLVAGWHDDALVRRVKAEMWKDPEKEAVAP